jgi:ABC-type branched-subunit amino acid transport system substrate-binding protein
VLVLAVLATACGTQVDKSAYLHAVELGRGSAQRAGSSGSGGQGPAQSSGGGAGQGGVGSSGASSTAGRSGSSSPSTATGGGAPGSSNPYDLSTTELGSTILVGMHLPETGAAPLPMGWQQDVTTVQSWLDANPVNGRKVTFDVQDDGYDPSTGQAACTKILDANPVVALGWSMPEVELDCGQLFAAHGIAYLARGASPNIVTSCSKPICYFASPSDDLQGRLGADYVMSDLGGAGKKIGMVWENDQPASPQAFAAEIKTKGGNLVVNQSSVPRQSDFSSTIVKLQQAGCQLVFLSMAPVDAITMSTQAQNAGFHPTWFGLGTYWNYNMTLQSAGMAMDGAVTFSPWVSIDSAAAGQWKQVDAQYSPGAAPDDIGLIIFGLGSLLQAALQAAGPHVSEASLVSALNSLQFSAPFWGPIAYSATNHFGPTSVAVFKGDGQAQRFDQISGFTSGF